MTEEQIIKRYQFPGMNNVKLSELKKIFESMFESIVKEFESENYDEPGYNYVWAMWCTYE